MPTTPTRTLRERVRRSDPVAAVAAGAKAALRRWGMATADLRPPPDFLIVGTKRGGTTSLHDYLLRHPAVLPLWPRPERVKGTYFLAEGWSSQGRRWYLSHFPTRLTRALASRRVGERVAAGESTPYDLFHPLAPARARELAPDARIVVLLRDPVERAFSHYKERRRHDHDLLPFGEAVAAESARTAGEEERILADPAYVSFAHRHWTYVAQSRYSAGLRRWLEVYPAEQVLVLRSEDLFAKPHDVYAEVLAHLGLSDRPLEGAEQLNAEPSRDMDDDVRRLLEGELRDDVVALEALLGRNMGWSVP
jgi:hypothetical protein